MIYEDYISKEYFVTDATKDLPEDKATWVITIQVGSASCPYLIPSNKGCSHQNHIGLYCGFEVCPLKLVIPTRPRQPGDPIK